jgi:hypothetical protein
LTWIVGESFWSVRFTGGACNNSESQSFVMWWIVRKVKQWVVRKNHDKQKGFFNELLDHRTCRDFFWNFLFCSKKKGKNCLTNSILRSFSIDFYSQITWFINFWNPCRTWKNKQENISNHQQSTILNVKVKLSFMSLVIMKIPLLYYDAMCFVTKKNKSGANNIVECFN